MRVYLSGPMKGRPEGNVPAFARCTKELRSLGYDVVSPHEIFQEGDVGEPADYDKCLRDDIRELMTCQAIVVMDDWEKSNGVRIELVASLLTGIRMIHYEDAVIDAQAILLADG